MQQPRLQQTTRILLTGFILSGIAFQGCAIPPEQASKKLSQLATEGFGLLGMPSVNVKETEAGYDITIPLSRPEDAARVQTTIQPNQIQISGQFSLGNGGSSQFMKSFTPSSPVDPSRVSRSVVGKTLKILIPKQAGKGAPDNGSPQPAPSQKHKPSHPHIDPQSFI